MFLVVDGVDVDDDDVDDVDVDIVVDDVVLTLTDDVSGCAFPLSLIHI